MILVMLEDVLEDEELAEKLDAIKYSSTLIILSPHTFIRDSILAMVNPPNLITHSLSSSSFEFPMDHNLNLPL